MWLLGTDSKSPERTGNFTGNGGPADAFQTDGLTLHKESNDERFPVIG